MANWRSYIDPSIGDGQNTIDSIIANGATYGLQISDDLSVTGLSTFSGTVRLESTAGVDLSDNSKIRFGNGNDLRISHTSDLSNQNDSNGDSVLDGSTWASYIQEAGTGPLIFKSNGGPSTGAFQFYDTSWRPILKLFSGSGARVALYYAGSEKLITSSTGINVTGDIKVGTSQAQGVILTSPNGTEYRLIVANDGTLSTTAV